MICDYYNVKAKKHKPFYDHSTVSKQQVLVMNTCCFVSSIIPTRSCKA